MNELRIQVFAEEDCDDVLAYQTYWPPRVGEEIYYEGWGTFKITDVEWVLSDTGASPRVESARVRGYFIEDEREEEEASE